MADIQLGEIALSTFELFRSLFLLRGSCLQSGSQVKPHESDTMVLFLAAFHHRGYVRFVPNTN